MNSKPFMQRSHIIYKHCGQHKPAKQEETDLFNFFTKSDDKTLEVEGVLLFDSRYFITSAKRPLKSPELLDINLPAGAEVPSPGSRVRFQIQKDSLTKTKPAQATAVEMEIISEEPQNLSVNINTGVEMLEMIPENSHLLDARSEGEYARGHIAGATLLPVQEIDKVADVVPDKSDVIMCYCGSGSRSATAANKLRKMGYKIVIQLGGLNSYTGKLVS